MAVEPRLDAWLSVLERDGGTDMLLTAGSKPLLRVAGRLRPLEEVEILSGEEIEAIARTQIRDQYGDRLHLGRAVSFSFSWRGTDRIRADAFYQRHSCSLALRRVPAEVPTPEGLGLPPAVSAALESDGGLVIVSGPRRSGRSASVAAMVGALSRSRACHIVTVEDPIDYVHRDALGAVSQLEVGGDTESIVTGARTAVRIGADVVVLGDLPEPEAVATALSLAESGRLVIVTVHCAGSAAALTRILEVFPAGRRDHPRAQLASSLVAVIDQRLLRRRGGGMVAAFEVLSADATIRRLLLDTPPGELAAMVRAHWPAGSPTMEEHLRYLVGEGLVSFDDAVLAGAGAEDPPGRRTPVFTVAGVQ